MSIFPKKVSSRFIFFPGIFLAVMLEHTIFGLAMFRGQVPSLTLLFLCLSLFFSTGPFWPWYFKILVTGFLVEMTSSTIPGFKLVLIFFCGMILKRLLVFINQKTPIVFLCFFSIFFLIVEGIPLIICFLLKRPISFSLYAFGARFIYSLFLAVPLSYTYDRFFKN